MKGDIEIPVCSPNIKHRLITGLHWIKIGFRHIWYGKTVLQGKNMNININQNND